MLLDKSYAKFNKSYPIALRGTPGQPQPLLPDLPITEHAENVNVKANNNKIDI